MATRATPKPQPPEGTTYVNDLLQLARETLETQQKGKDACEENEAALWGIRHAQTALRLKAEGSSDAHAS